MRDLLVVTMVGAVLPFILRWPHVGVLAFSWISIMNPHRLTFGFAYSLPYAFLLFTLTIGVWLLSKERKLPPLVAPTWALALFTLWIGYTTVHAWLPEPAFHKFDRSLKVILGAVLVAILIDRRERVIQFVWVLCLSMGFYGVKGGLFTIITGGDNRVWGAPDTFMEDNNALALSLVMITPLMYFLFLESRNRWVKAGVLAMMLLTLVAVFGTYSRGGLLALAGMGALLWLRTKHKMITLVAIFVIGTVALANAPPAWLDRMASIQTYSEDPSVQSRFRSWGFALDVAAESPITGGGFQVFRLNEVIEKGELTYLNAHSIFFEVLGEHGFVGLILFVFLGMAVFFSCSYVMARARIYPELEWAGRLGSCAQVTLAGYAIGGSFLNMAFFDLLYFVLALVITITGIVAAYEAEHTGKPAKIVHSAWNSNAPASIDRLRTRTAA